MHYIISILTLCLSALHSLSACFFAVLLLQLGGKYVSNEGRIINKLSVIYLEIYVMQWTAFLLLRNGKWRLDNDVVFALMSVIFTVVMALIIHPLFKKTTLAIKVKSNN